MSFFFANFALTSKKYMAKILVTGSNGQLGHELRRVFEHDMPGLTTYIDREELDLTDREAVEQFLRAGNYSHVVNCAAYTAVDRAEEEKLQCKKANVDIPSNIGRLADELDLKIIHISTDYVFDGLTWLPYSEGAKPEPLSVYGTTKRMGETVLMGLAPTAMIIRTGWLYSPYGRNFLKTVLRLAEKEGRIGMVADQTGTPTYAGDLAQAISDIIRSKHWNPGIFHYANEGVASWYDFAVAILEEYGLYDKARMVEPIPTSDYPTPATRPFYSVLDKSKIKGTYGLAIPHWRDALRRCISQLSSIQENG